MIGIGAHLYPLWLRAPGAVRRALAVKCPACGERAGTACRVVEGVPEVHDRRESIAYHMEGTST